MSSQNIFLDGILMDVNVSFWSGAKALQASDLGMNKEDIAEAYRLGRKMLIPHEVVRSFRRIEGKARRLVEYNSFKFPIGNARFVPKKKFNKVVKELQGLQDSYMSLVEELVQNYDTYRQDMMPIYEEAAKVAFINSTPSQHTFGIEYDREAERQEYIQQFLNRISSFYPPVESLRNRFSLDWDVYEIALPKMKSSDSDKVSTHIAKEDIDRETYRNQSEQKIGAFIDDVVKVLRQQTMDVCDRIKENLTEGKVIHGRTINSLKSFIEDFSEMNFVGDYEVENMLNKFKEDFLDKYGPTQFMEDTSIQVDLKRRLNDIVTTASDMTDIKLVSGSYRRRIDWKEPEREVA